MSRPLRIEYEGAWYHVMNRGRRKEKIFFNEKDFEIFKKTLSEISHRYDIKIHAYVLMSNHYHLLINTPRANLSRAMRHLNGTYTQRFNKKHKIDGSLFRGRFKSILVNSEEYLLELVRYIHRNPYKSGIEKKIGDYKWCSHKQYIKNVKSEDFLVVKEVLSRFSKYEKEAIRKLKAFVEKETPKDLMEKLDSVKWPAILGGKEFKEMIKEKYMGKEIDKKEIPEYADSFVRNEQAKLEIDRIKVKYSKELASKRGRKERNIRLALIYVLRGKYGLELKTIGEISGGVGYSSISRRYKIAEEEILSGEGCFEEYRTLEDRD